MSTKKSLFDTTAAVAAAVATEEGQRDPRSVLVSVEDLSKKYLGGLAPITIYKKVHEGDADFIPHLHIGRRVFFRLSEVLAYLDRQEAKAAEKTRSRIERRERLAERERDRRSSNTRKRAA